MQGKLLVQLGNASHRVVSGPAENCYAGGNVQNLSPGKALGEESCLGLRPRQDSEQALGVLVPMSSWKASEVMGELAIGRRSNVGMGEIIYDS